MHLEDGLSSADSFLLSDRVNLFGMGHRRPYIIIGLLMQMAGMLLLATVSVAAGLTAFALAALAASMGMAMYDTNTDGLALDATPEAEYGSVQGVMVGGRAAGVLFLLLAGGAAIEKLGWPSIFIITGLVPLVPLALIALTRETKESMRREHFQWGAFRAFGRRTVLALGVMGFLYAFALDGVQTFLTAHVKEAMAVSIRNVGRVLAPAMIGRILGALSSGWLCDKVGRKRSMLAAVVLGSVGCVLLGVGSGPTTIAFVALPFGFAYGYYAAGHSVLSMDQSDPRISASMFAIFMMLVNMGTSAGQAVGGVLTEVIGFGGMVSAMAAINLVGIFLVVLLFRRRRAQGSGSADSNRSV